MTLHDTKEVFHGKVTYDLIKSEYDDTIHKYYIIVTNTGNEPTNILTDDYYIRSEGKTFNSSNRTIEDTNINLDISTNVIVIFEMDLQYLYSYDAVLSIDNGLFFENNADIILISN